MACRLDKQDWNWDDNGSFNEQEASEEIFDWLSRLKEHLNADAAVVALSDPKRRYFRHDFYPKYKFNRTHGTPPNALPGVKTLLRGGLPGFPAKEKPGLEADDILGILATHPTLVEGEKVIVAVDKDLKQIAGKHYNPDKPNEGITKITEKEADDFFFTQCLTGDPTDGIPGCPGIGPKKAAKILAEAREAYLTTADFETREQCVWRSITDAYEAKGLTEEDALVQARCARILRHTDYDFDNARVIPWTP